MADGLKLITTVIYHRQKLYSRESDSIDTKMFFDEGNALFAGVAFFIFN